MQFEHRLVQADLVVVGAGVPGICAAIQAAREGLTVVLINDRGCVGGNSSQEICIPINGANDVNPFNINSREGGIVDEIRQECKYRSVAEDRYVVDGVLTDFLLREKGISLYLNTCVDTAKTDDSRIISVSGTQNTTETRFTFKAEWFIDDTGNGTLGAICNAEYMLGREASETFHEKIAPKISDHLSLPSTLSFWAYDTGKPRPYIAPDYALDIERTGALERRIIPQDKFYQFCWYYELDGDIDQIKEREKIIYNHKALIYGIWNYIKNSGKYPQSENYALSYVSVIPGTREYRRLKGDFILSEGDISTQREYEDAVGHGGWPIDLHAARGFFDSDVPNRHIHLRGVYQIPYRCGYSKNIKNLFMCGRCMSLSHVALGSARVSGTLSTLGQAVGMAAAICKKYEETPRDVYERHMPELQQRLLREDQMIPGMQNQDPKDLALNAKVCASSEASAEIVQIDGWLKIEEGLGFSLPLSSPTNHLILTVRTPTDTKLTYHIYKPCRSYNFGPDKEIHSQEIIIPATKLSKVAIDISALPAGSYYFFDIEPSQGLELAYSDNPLPATMFYFASFKRNENIWDYDTLDYQKRTWKREPNRFPLFEYDSPQHIYSPKNIVNGYNRAFSMPNMWVCAPGDGRPCLTLEWDNPVALSMCQITFGIDTSCSIMNFPENVFPFLALDYDVYTVTNETRTLVASVRNNHAKRNRLTFPLITTQRLEFDFLRYKGRMVAVQEIRCER